jgi:hypothetical protein
MADSLVVKAGTTATFYAVPPVAVPDTPQAPPIFGNQYQVSVGPSALTIVTTPPPKSFFKMLTVPTVIFASPDYQVLASISLLLAGGAPSTILELLATYSFLNPADDEDIDVRFVIRDSVKGILCSSSASAGQHKYAAGAIVFRGNFSPEFHNFVEEDRRFTLETKILPGGAGRIVVGGGIFGENESGNAALYIQKLDG